VGDEVEINPAVVGGAAEAISRAGSDLRAGYRHDAGAGVGATAGFGVSIAVPMSSERSATVFDAITNAWQAWADKAAVATTNYLATDDAGAAALHTLEPGLQ
jgi:hypothetical protein